MENITFKFDEHNSNCIVVCRDGKVIHYIACPPIDRGCDVINFTDESLSNYSFDTTSFILITTVNDRKLYYRGELMAETRRINL